MKPIWIVDDDQSIRFVLEKALLREDLPTRSFTNPREVLAALADAVRLLGGLEGRAKVEPVQLARDGWRQGELGRRVSGRQ